MKKFLALLLAALLVLSVFAVAEEAEEAEEAGIPLSPDMTLIFETPDGFWIEVDKAPEKKAAAKDELTAMAEAEDIADYFGETADQIKAITGNDEITVTEFAPVIAGGYEEEMGDISVALTCPTAYEEGEMAAILFNVAGAWYTFDAAGNENGALAFTLDSETVKAIVENGAFIAVAK